MCKGERVQKEETMVENDAMATLADMADTLEGVHRDFLLGNPSLLYGGISFAFVAGDVVHIYLEIHEVNLLLKNAGAVATPYTPVEEAKDHWRGWTTLPVLHSCLLIAVIFAAYQHVRRNQMP